MTLAELLPWLNLLLVPIAGYVFSIERRLTRLETREQVRIEQKGAFTHRRATDPQP